MSEAALGRPVTMYWRSLDSLPWLTWSAVALTVGGLALGAFGLPQIDLHGPTHYVGIMDPLCGMTRAGRALVLGRLTTAWTHNPGVFFLAFAIAGVLARAVIGIATGRWLSVTFLARRSLLGILAIGVVALWVNQQLHAELLTASTRI